MSADEEKSEFLDFARQLAVAAGKRLMDGFGEAKGREKGRFDLVTDLDVAVEEDCARELERRYPGHRLIAEERHAADAPTEGYCWVIDPLDGTVNYASGVPFFCFSVALMKEGDPWVACVLDPARGEMFHAMKNEGAFLNGRPIEAERNAQARIPASGSSDLLNWGLAEGPSGRLAQFMKRHGKLRILGAQALSLCYVAAGRLKAALSRESRLWDDAAGALIAREAGARYTDFDGRDLFPLRPDRPFDPNAAIRSLAAVETVHEELVGILGDAGRRREG
jgi:myo-inositol-1(or 4)-monophosphatase